MTPEYIAVDRQNDVAIIQLNRPPANAFNLELAREIETAFDEVMADTPGALVVTGTGTFFSGGLDLKAVPFYSPEQQREFLTQLNRMIGKIYGCPIPTVAAVNGHAIAGAFVLVLTTDYRIGPTGDAKFGMTEARAGIPFPAAPMVVVHAELAPPDVRYTTLYARNFGPDEAQRRGVFDELHSPEHVLARAIEVAKDLATMPPDSYRRVKHQVRAAAMANIAALNAAGSDPMLQTWISPDSPEASAAILAEKVS